jgi:phage tail-like protein
MAQFQVNSNRRGNTDTNQSGSTNSNRLGNTADPYITCLFHVEIEGIEEAVFQECEGLEAETEVLSFEEGGLNNYPHKLPVRTRFPNVSLKRGITDSSALWEWYYKVINGMVERKNMSVILYDAKSNEVKRWSFERAYPVKWSGPRLKADENTIGIEVLEITHEGMVVG